MQILTSFVTSLSESNIIKTDWVHYCCGW